MQFFWDGGWSELRKYELYEAVTNNDLPRMNELITTKGVDVQFINHNDNGKNILHKACEKGHKEAVCFILNLKCKAQLINQRDNSQQLPIDYAVKNQHSQIVNILQNPESDDSTLLLLDNWKM
mmetsp:Transcript_20576/g.28870  ORF Transcript_20576/g.28870 Transcript_20576/m.28870 type:complete len:123 (+) Transcript_20576:117-485(+)